MAVLRGRVFLVIRPSIAVDEVGVPTKSTISLLIRWWLRGLLLVCPVRALLLTRTVPTLLLLLTTVALVHLCRRAALFEVCDVRICLLQLLLKRRDSLLRVRILFQESSHLVMCGTKLRLETASVDDMGLCTRSVVNCQNTTAIDIFFILTVRSRELLEPVSCRDFLILFLQTKELRVAEDLLFVHFVSFVLRFLVRPANVTRNKQSEQTTKPQRHVIP